MEMDDATLDARMRVGLTTSLNAYTSYGVSPRGAAQTTTRQVTEVLFG
jgi:hypothetical protein